ncbi:MAG: SprT-like domain-containing protein [Chitinophagaceae bacterium]|nr:SprT-like domain-containing protein [Chitinophagaceae bacterium]
MANKTEHPMQELSKFLPEGSFEQVVQYLHQYKVHLTVSKARKSVLGDYRHAFQGNNHRISVNGNLNVYEFLITLLHELAHLLTFEQYGPRVPAHGKEWKTCYSQLLNHFVSLRIFPPDIERELKISMKAPAATANGEVGLMQVLRTYNKNTPSGKTLLSALPEGTLFKLDSGKIFRKGALRRKRYECIELRTGAMYTVSGIAEVQLVVIKN